MLSDTLQEKYGFDTPIFTDEILALFPQYTKAYVFRLIKAAEENGSLARVDTGVYYVPQMTPFGPSAITASDIAEKRYIRSGGNTYGLYCGMILQNVFSVTAQMTNTPEIVTNREATRRRKVIIAGMPFILRKSRTEITNENVDSYRVLQLLTENDGTRINKKTKQAISDFIRAKKISKESLLDLGRVFPDRTLRNLVYTGTV